MILYFKVCYIYEINEMLNVRDKANVNIKVDTVQQQAVTVFSAIKKIVLKHNTDIHRLVLTSASGCYKCCHDSQVLRMTMFYSRCRKASSFGGLSSKTALCQNQTSLTGR